MPFGQRSVWFQLTTQALIFTWFIWRFVTRQGAGQFDGSDGLAALGRMTLWTIAALIGLIVAVHILGMIAAAIANRGKLPDDTTDERDRAIEARGERIARTGAGLAFLLGIVLMTVGQSMALVIAVMFLGMILADMVGNIVKLSSYSWG